MQAAIKTVHEPMQHQERQLQLQLQRQHSRGGIEL
jgi:hypothetical protein